MSHTDSRVSLIEQLCVDLDAAFGRKGSRVAGLVNQVQLYGGEFTSAELGKVSTASPTVFITALGFSPVTESRYVATPARKVNIALFVLTKGEMGKHGARENRMLQAMNIAEHIAAWLPKWNPQNELSSGCIGRFDLATAENMFGRQVDDKGLAIWLVRSTIDVSSCCSDGTPLLIAPTFEVISNPVVTVPDEAVPEAEVVVTNEVGLEFLTPRM